MVTGAASGQLLCTNLHTPHPQVSYASSYRDDQAMKAAGSYAEFRASKAASRTQQRTTVSQILQG